MGANISKAISDASASLAGSGLKFEDGKIVFKAQVDSDKDGKPSAVNVTEVDFAEAINEAFKTDPSWLMNTLKMLGILK